MSKILRYAKESTLMDIQLTIGEEKFRFNLYRELKISETGLEDSLKNQASSYGLLTMVHKALIKNLGDLKVEEKKAYASAYIKFKSEINKETNRPNSDDLAKQKAELDIRYIRIQKSMVNVQYDLNRIEACVRAFEQKKDMLQTLSANIRKERG